MARYAAIIGTGMYLPEIELSNSRLKEEMEAVSPGLGVVVDKFQESSGIKTRWLAPKELATSDLAVRAGQEALRAAGIGAEQLDMIILGTDSPDYLTPATSVVVQHKLGARNAGTFDVGCACASFPTALAAAAGLLAENGWMKYVLVIGAYMMSRLSDPKDITRFFYGDGAGAAVLTAAAEPGFITSAYLADGSYHKHWGIYAGGTYEPASEEALKAGRTVVRLIERYPPEVNHEGWPKLVRQLAERGRFGLDQIDLALFTQVRLPSIELVMADLGLPMSKTHWIMNRMGYTGSACVPMCLHDAVKNGKAGRGDLVVLVGSGVGYNQAGVALRMT